MSLADAAKSLRVPSRLVANPTDLGAAFPHGGTDLGIISNIVFTPGLKTKDIIAEEFGGQTVETIFVAENPLLALNLTGASAAAVSTFFRDAGGDGFGYKGTVRAGGKGSALSFKLLIAPRNVVDHPGLIIYKAIPMINESDSLRWSITEEFGIPMIFKSIRDATNRVYDVNKLASMSV